LRYDPGYWNMHRGRFDAWMGERAAAAGAKLRYQTRVLDISPSQDGVRLATSAGPLHVALVLDATGWRSLSRKLLHMPGSARAPLLGAVQGRIASDLPLDSMWAVYRSAVTPFYGWLVPQGAGEFLLGCGVLTDTKRRGAAPPASGATAWAVLQPYLDYIAARGHTCRLLDAKPRGCPITWIGGPAQLWWGAGRVFAVGEAAGLVSPSSGGGIHYALAHAAALAQALLDAGGGALAHSATAGGAIDTRLVLARTQSLLAPQLARLRFSCIKAWTAAHPTLRGMATRLLPAYTGAHVEHLPWS
jgi:flavin-dependent dehydrogenase